jgi:outer membrane biosynthesis protein TonB
MRDIPVVVTVFLVSGMFVSAAPVQVFGSDTVGIELMDKGRVEFVAGESQPTPLPLQAATDPTQPTQPNPQPEQPTQPGEKPKKPKKPTKPPTNAQRSHSG